MLNGLEKETVKIAQQLFPHLSETEKQHVAAEMTFMFMKRKKIISSIRKKKWG